MSQKTISTQGGTRIPVKIKADSPQFIPMYKTKGSAAADLIANIPPNDIGERIIRIAPGHIETIDCGFTMALPPGWEAQIRARSGLAQKGIQVTNGIGTIDDDYRGRIMVIINNAGREIVNIKHGDRFAQMALKPVWYFEWNIVSELDETDRKGGFGSTGSV
jgi:dUTP pyrophosphatase